MDEENKNLEPQPEVVKSEETNNVSDSKKSGEGKGFSVTAMILGIVSLVLWCYWPLSITCAVLAIIFGVIGKKKAGRGMAITGLVLGIITLCIWVIIFLMGAAFIAAIPGECFAGNGQRGCDLK